MQYAIRSLSPQRVEDFFTFFEHVAFAEHPEWGCDCFCCFFHAASREAWDACTRESNMAMARELIISGRMRGLLAYDGEKPVGWCHFDVLKNLPGARLFYGGLASADDGKALIACFTIAQGYRRRGIASALLQHVLDDLKAQGVRQVEAYPVIGNESQEHNYHGPLSMYLKQGFTVVRKLKDHALVEKTL
ncbi:MAG: GNAT family N-acetyltransferase [Clostridiales bacterium]|nr:GNAT family N-acetyltransferase [Clostridiales bacterium]